MGKETDRMPAQVDCLDAERLPLTLISTAGFHCEVWRSSGVIVREDGSREPVDFVVKRSREPCPPAYVRVLARDHRRLRAALDEMVPPAIFVTTRIDGESSVIVLAQTCQPWFDLANPWNEEEALELLRHHPRSLDGLERFVRAARGWAAEADGRIIDLHGAQNLVLDREWKVRYLDSFGVFLFPDVLETIEEDDEGLRERIAVSRARLDYLERLAEAARRREQGGAGA